jgi:phosphatidate phosphatase LPIN
MTDLVDQMFPPIHRQFDAHFTDFNYWKAPVQEYELPDLTPPSPALSARSDTSNRSTLARLRNLSLMGTRQTSGTGQFSLPPPVIADDGQAKSERGRQIGTRDSHLRQMSSLERFTNTLSAFAPSSSSTAASPTASSSTFFDSGDEDEGADYTDLERQKRTRKLRRESMPGSLPGSEGGSDNEMVVEENEHGEGEEGAVGVDVYCYDEEEEAEAEHAFDDDLFATGEMESVPFL